MESSTVNMSHLCTVITGATSGIGLEFVREYHRRGNVVVGVARREDILKKLQDELGTDRFIPAVLDLSTFDAGSKLESFLHERNIQVSTLINCAGIGFHGNFHKIDLDKSLRSMDLNCRILVELTRRFLPSMVERNEGSIINIASTAAFQPVPNMAVYGATKSFVVSFTEALAYELRKTNIKVHVLSPGLTATEFQRNAGTDKIRFNFTPSMTAREVVEKSMELIQKKRVSSVIGTLNAIGARFAKISPASMTNAIVGFLFAIRFKK